MLQTISRWRRRPTDLKATLLLRICLVAAGCLAATALLAVHEARRDDVAKSDATAEVVGKQLDLQLLRIAAFIDVERRFPDWDAVIAGLPLAGQCIELRRPTGALLRSHCTGTPAAAPAAPSWFVSAWKALYGQDGSVERAVGKGADHRGTLIVTSDQSAVAGRAWTQVRQLLALTALIVLVLCSLVYLAMVRALSPSQQLISGLETIAAGNFALRLPPFQLKELDHISKASNALAAKIELMLVERTELTKRLVNSQEEERRALARELHDEYGQNLAAIAALAASIEKSADGIEADVASEAGTVGNIARDMMQTLRGTLLRLRPADVEDFGLDEALRQLVAVWNVSCRPKTRFGLAMPAAMGPLPPSTAMHVFRIAQEGLTNAVRHAQASRVDLRLEHIVPAKPEDARHICLTIEDDGKGSNVGSEAVGTGIGLLNMRERVTALGGTIDFLHPPGGGLRVQVVIPAPAPAGEARLQ